MPEGAGGSCWQGLTESLRPLADRLVAGLNASCCEYLLNHPQAQWNLK
jgi:hypothetical protein